MACNNIKKEKKRIFWILLLLLFLSWSVCGQAAGITMVSVAGNKVNLRKGPSAQYPIIWELGEGFPLQVIGSQGNWLKVSKNRKARINIRSGPGTKYKIVGKAEYGVVFETLQRKGGWVKVRHERGLTGWIKRSLLWGW
jgi:uncharacterized protein YgiM (DUF1202 family)